MKKLLLLALFLFFPLLTFSQDDQEQITIDFQAISRKSALLTIEKKSSYHFFYDATWLDTFKDSVSGSYQKKSLKIVLDDLFKKTTLNYFITGNKVILTNNSLLFETLPSDYFGKTTLESTSDSNTEKPVFYQQYDSITSSKKNATLLLIGKESKKANQKMFTLSGQIRNAKTGEVIPNLLVRVRNKKYTCTSDKNGSYSLDLPYGLNTIQTESLNYATFSKKVMVYSDGNLDISVSESINQLKEVLVKGKKNQSTRTAIAGVTTLSSEGIKNIPLILGERDLLKVATTLPGIKTTGEGSAGFNVRGGKEDQNLILLDNAVLYNPAHFFGFFSALNPYTTSKVAIYKGSIPAEFGGRLSSVFDISTKNGSFSTFSGEGGIGPVTSTISISTPIIKDHSSLVVGGRATYSGWILRSLRESTLQNSQASFYDGIVKYNHKWNANNSLETSFYYSKDAFSISSDSLYKYSNRLFTMKWEHQFTTKNKAAFIVTNSEYQFNIDYETTGLNSFDYGYKINETQFITKLTYLFNKKHKLNYGLSSKVYQINPGYLTPKNSQSPLTPVTIDKEKGLESAFYLSDNYKITDKLLLDIGLRYSIYSALGVASPRIYEPNTPKSDATVVSVKKYGNNSVFKTYGGLEPRLAARYFITDDFSVKAGYDKTYQYIHLLSSNTTQSPTDTWKLSDLNVKPQSAEQYSLGLYKDLSEAVYEVSIEGYYKKTKNILDYKVGADLFLSKNIETQLLQGKGKAYGIEFLLKKEIGRLNGWLGYTYSRTFIKLDSPFNEEKVNNGNFFAANFDKPHDVSAVLNWKFTKRFSFSSNFVYQTGRPITYPIGAYTYGNAEYTLYSDRNKFRIPDYYRLDVGFNIEGNHKLKKLAHSFWNLSVYNVLGRNNPYSIYFITKTGQIKAYKTSIFAIPVPTISYNFKF